jgi:hypothetical protein
MANPANCGSYSQDEVDSLLSKAIKIKTYSIDNQEIGSLNYLNWSFDSTISGYTKVAIWVSLYNATENGHYSSICSVNFQELYYASDASKSYVQARNNNDKAARIRAVATIVYVKDAFADVSEYSN